MESPFKTLDLLEDSKIVVPVFLTLSNVFVYLISPLFIPYHVIVGMFCVVVISLIISKFISPAINKSYNDFVLTELEDTIDSLKHEVRNRTESQKQLEKLVRRKELDVKTLKNINDYKDEKIKTLQRSQTILRKNEEKLAELLINE